MPTLSILATNEFVIPHAVTAETSLVEPSVYVIIADNFVEVPEPISMWTFPGTILNVVGSGGAMVKDAVFEIVPEVAVMPTLPCFSVVTSPVESTFAKLGSETDHTAVLIALELPSEKAPEAANCCVSPAATLAVPGDTVMDWRVGEDAPIEPVEPLEPLEQEAKIKEAHAKTTVVHLEEGTKSPLEKSACSVNSKFCGICI